MCALHCGNANTGVSHLYCSSVRVCTLVACVLIPVPCSVHWRYIYYGGGVGRLVNWCGCGCCRSCAAVYAAAYRGRHWLLLCRSLTIQIGRWKFLQATPVLLGLIIPQNMPFYTSYLTFYQKNGIYLISVGKALPIEIGACFYSKLVISCAFIWNHFLEWLS